MRRERKRPEVNRADYSCRLAQDDRRISIKMALNQRSLEGGSTLRVRFQLAQHVMDEFCNFILVARVTTHWLVPDRTIRQPLRRLLRKVTAHRAFSLADAAVP